MGQAAVATDQKGASRLKAALVSLDESGSLMAPLVRRSWAPRSATPVLYQRGRSHQKVSVIAALVLPAERTTVACYFRLHPNANINAARVRSVLRHLATELEGAPFLLMWDRPQAHRAAAVRAFLATHQATKTVFLPAYAPELDPVEYLWNYLKTNPLANATHLDTRGLATAAGPSARSLQRSTALLRSFIQHSPHSLRLR